MDAKKEFLYTLTLDSKEMNLLVAELNELFAQLPKLRGSTAAMYNLSQRLTTLLGTKDFDEEKYRKIREAVKNGGMTAAIREAGAPRATAAAQPITIDAKPRTVEAVATPKTKTTNKTAKKTTRKKA